MPEPTNYIDLVRAVEEDNLTRYFDDEYLDYLGSVIFDEYEEDERSRKDWVDSYVRAMEVATQVYATKDVPWRNASNIKFPLITIGALQFHARAYPSLIPSKGVVQTGVIGIDFTGEKSLLSKLIAAHLNYQFEYQMTEWEEDMDRLLIALPITGCEFKKTYFDVTKGINCSEHVRASDLVIHYYAKSVESAARKTQIIRMNLNEIIEFQRAGLFRDIDLLPPEPRDDEITKVADRALGFKAPKKDMDTPYKILEWHGWIDLDNDEYKEPYIVTIDSNSKKVLRIRARYYAEGIKADRGGTIVRIEPIEYFTKYDFVPNPTGGIYGIGFGILLGPLNESVNTNINQLTDAGTLSNMQSGFISRNLRIKGGRANFSPGEWKEVNASGMDIKQGLYPLPVREPSMVLFQLLQLLINYGERLTSTTDMMIGENPGQNQKATTTMAVLDQGMKVFTAVYKRIRRAMGKEFNKVFQLNYYYLDEESTKILFDGEATITRKMYDPKNTVVFPSADPEASSETQRAARAQMMLSWLPLGGFNDYEVKRRALEAIGEDDPEALLLPPDQPPPPDPRLIKVQADMEHNKAKEKLDTIKLVTDLQNKDRELGIKEEANTLKRYELMLKGFAQGADASLRAREIANKDLDSRRKANAKSTKSE